MQIQAHQNGDRAVDQFLEAVAAARVVHGDLDKRPIAIHAQLVRPEQWQQMRELGVVPSLYPTALSAQGDIVAMAVPDRLEWFNAARTALESGIRFSAHNDAPLVPMSGVALLDGLVNRRTESRAQVAPEQRIGMHDALKSITVWAAYQHFEDDVKGTLEVGKYADLVVLDRDPLTVNPEEILGVRVLETIRRGTTIFQVAR